MDGLDVRHRRVRGGGRILEIFWRRLQIVEILVGSDVLVLALFRALDHLFLRGSSSIRPRILAFAYPLAMQVRR